MSKIPEPQVAVINNRIVGTDTFQADDGVVDGVVGEIAWAVESRTPVRRKATRDALSIVVSIAERRKADEGKGQRTSVTDIKTRSARCPPLWRNACKDSNSFDY
ncbi:MAG: hypothetical protein EXS05_15975 [Planctomycetaceae bacterium]|nr:hypothetical protein [Planctomycetaceae bacterium]